MRISEAGYLVIADLLDAAEAATIIEGCEAWLVSMCAGGPREAHAVVGDKPAGGTRRLAQADRRLGSIAAVVERNRLLEAAARLAGPGHDLAEPEVTYRCPTPGHGGQKLHADAPPRTTPQACAAPPEVVTAIIALVDFGPDNGATRLIPGSHRRPDLQELARTDPDRLERHADAIMLAGPAGTAFVFNGHVLHSGTPNRSLADRPAVQISWRTAEPNVPPGRLQV